MDVEDGRFLLKPVASLGEVWHNRFDRYSETPEFALDFFRYDHLHLGSDISRPVKADTSREDPASRHLGVAVG